MTREEFKSAILKNYGYAINELDDEKNVLDLRVGRYPYEVNVDNEVFSIDELDEIWDYVEGRVEWYVDIYENYYGANCAEYTGYSVASWSNL